MGKTSRGLSWGLDAGIVMRNWSFPRRFVIFYNQSCYLVYQHPPQGLRGVNSESSCGPFLLHTHPPTFLPVCSSMLHLPPTVTHQLAHSSPISHLTIYLPNLHSPVYPHTTTPSISPSHQPTHPRIFPPTNLPACSSTHPPRYSTQHMSVLS